MYNPENYGYSTGKEVEQELLGKIEEEEYKDYMKEAYLPWEKSMNIVKQCQPKKKKEFAKSLLNALSKKLCLGKGDVKYFTAVNSHLDFKHGVDAFFEFKIEDGIIETITFDLTKNPNKDEHKADVIGLVPADGLDKSVDDQEFREYINSFSNQIIRTLEAKCE